MQKHFWSSIMMNTNAIEYIGFEVIPVEHFSEARGPCESVATFFEVLNTLFSDFPDGVDKGIYRCMNHCLELCFWITDFFVFIGCTDAMHFSMCEWMWGDREEWVGWEGCKFILTDKSWCTDFWRDDAKEKRNTIFSRNRGEFCGSIFPAIITRKYPDMLVWKASSFPSLNKIFSLHEMYTSWDRKCTHHLHMGAEICWCHGEVTNCGGIARVVITHIVIHEESNMWSWDTWTLLWCDLCFWVMLLIWSSWCCFGRSWRKWWYYRRVLNWGFLRGILCIDLRHILRFWGNFWMERCTSSEEYGYAEKNNRLHIFWTCIMLYFFWTRSTELDRDSRIWFYAHVSFNNYRT